MNTINSQNDPRRILLDSALSRYQKVAIAVTVLLCALDGFDVLAVTYAAPGFLQEWGLSRGELGVALAMGLVGMALGSFFLAPLADILGRRRMIVFCLLVMALGMLASGLAGSMAILAFWRVITGLGIGAMICIINPLAAEYSNAKRRDFTIALMAVGYPIGGTLGGLAAVWLLENYSWRAVFYFGSALAIAFLPVVLRWLPEPITYLIDKPSRDSLARVNQFLARCGHSAVSVLPAPTPRSRAVPVMEIFDPQRRWSTIQLTAINALYLMTGYFFLSWMPQMVADMGFSPADAARVAVTRDTAGIFGGILLGWFAHYLGLKRLAIIFTAAAGLAVIVFGRLEADMTQLKIVVGLAGFVTYGGIVALYAIMARTFDAHVRASGTGFVIGVGRVASASAPLLGGYLFAMNLSTATVTSYMAAGALTAAVILIFFRVRAIESG